MTYTQVVDSADPNGRARLASYPLLKGASKVCPAEKVVGGCGNSSDFSSSVYFEVHNFSLPPLIALG